MKNRALMRNVNLTLLFYFLLLPGVFSQPKPDYNHSYAVARAAPDSVGKSLLSLSGYFHANLHGSQELLRAFYFWTANEIVYDAENMFTFSSADDPDKIVARTLQERKAVCQGYAELFHELCEHAGIESYIVLGYTRQNGQVVGQLRARLRRGLPPVFPRAATNLVRRAAAGRRPRLVHFFFG